MAPKAGPSRKRTAKKLDPRKKPSVVFTVTNLQPGQRATTEEEKKQRIAERVKRNRLSAAESRRKKKKELAIQKAKLAWQDDHIAALGRAFTTELQLVNRLVGLTDLALRANLERNVNAIQGLLSNEFVYEAEEDEDDEEPAQDAPPASSGIANPAAGGVEFGDGSTTQTGLPTSVPEDMHARRIFQPHMASQVAAHYPGNMNFAGNMTVTGRSAFHNSAINSPMIANSVVNQISSWPAPLKVPTCAAPSLSKFLGSFASRSSERGFMLNMPPSPPNTDMDDMIMTERPWANSESGFNTTTMPSAFGTENLAINNVNDNKLFGVVMDAVHNEMDSRGAIGHGHPGGFNDQWIYRRSSMLPGYESEWRVFPGNQQDGESIMIND